MLEMLGEFKVENIPHAKDMMLNKYGYILEVGEVEDIQNRVVMLLNSSEFMRLITGECYREKAIRYKDNLRYIDLLVKSVEKKDTLSLFSADVWNVIDYKSSTTYAEHHSKQVKYYVKAVQEITADRVDGYICYLLKDKIKIIKI
jgi:exodeoxyribonuclease V beta subunit